MSSIVKPVAARGGDEDEDEDDDVEQEGGVARGSRANRKRKADDAEDSDTGEGAAAEEEDAFPSKMRMDGAAPEEVADSYGRSSSHHDREVRRHRGDEREGRPRRREGHDDRDRPRRFEEQERERKRGRVESVVTEVGDDAEGGSPVATPKRKPAPRAANPMARHRKMFGNLLGHLQKAKKQEEVLAESSAMQKRKELEEQAVQREKGEAERIRQQQRVDRNEQRSANITLIRENRKKQSAVLHQLSLVRAGNYCTHLANFIQTATQPPIYWKPKFIKITESDNPHSALLASTRAAVEEAHEAIKARLVEWRAEEVAEEAQREAELEQRRFEYEARREEYRKMMEGGEGGEGGEVADRKDGRGEEEGDEGEGEEQGEEIVL